MPKSKNIRKKKQNSNKLLKSAPSNTIIDHSPNSTLLATLINEKNLNGLSFFIKDLCNESQLNFDHNFKEWFNIFIGSINKDLNLAIYVAKNIYYNVASNNYIHNSVKATDILSEYIWKNCSETYKNECIFLSLTDQIDLQVNALPVENLVFLDSSIKYMQLISHISGYYQYLPLNSAKKRQKMQSKLANF